MCTVGATSIFMKKSLLKSHLFPFSIYLAFCIYEFSIIPLVFSSISCTIVSLHAVLRFISLSLLLFLSKFHEMLIVVCCCPAYPPPLSRVFQPKIDRSVVTSFNLTILSALDQTVVKQFFLKVYTNENFFGSDFEFYT